MNKPAAERWFWRVLFGSALFHLVHAVMLPILVTYDGSEYVRLCDLLTSPNFMTEYSFRRPPVYPFLLRLSFACLGRGPLAAQLPNLVLGFAGIALVGLSLFRLKRPILASLCVLLMTFDPVLIAYEHAILTEAGSFFCVALILYVLLSRNTPPGRKTLLLSLTLAFGYYQRPTLIYLAPLVALIHACDWLRSLPERGRAQWLGAGGHFAAVLLVPFVLAYPWNRLLAHSNEANFGQQILLYGILKQAVLPPDDPAIGPSRATYQSAIDACSPEGRMDLAGLTQSSLLPIIEDVLGRCESEGYAIFWRAVRSFPSRYLSGVARTTLYFAGLPNNDSENQYYVRSVIAEAAAGSKLQGLTHPLFTETQRDFTQKTRSWPLAPALRRLNYAYRIFLPLGVLLTVIGFFAALIRRDLDLAAFCALPLAVLAMYALTLIAVDRYVVPAYPFFIAGILVVPAFLFRRREPG